MREIGIGLIGYGTVGGGVVETLQRNGDMLAKRLNARFVVRRIAVQDPAKPRDPEMDPSIMTTDALSVIQDDSVDIVVELIGGEATARDLVLTALKAGKPVVTANKAMLAAHGAEIFEAAAESGVDICFEASVAGGIPIIRVLREGLAANTIHSIYGILNGTCNYILTRMEREHESFEAILEDAIHQGYAEADPGLDVDGHDAAHKASILAALAYGASVDGAHVEVEGIRKVSVADIEAAADLGYRIKLLAVIRRCNQGIEVRVHPALVPQDHLLASVAGSYNAVLIEGDIVGTTMYYGRGAGRLPTASAVVSDLVDAARSVVSERGARLEPAVGNGDTLEVVPADQLRSRYYLRMSLKDEPGVFARISSVLGKHGISIASLLQKEFSEGQYVTVIIVTHTSDEAAFAAAFSEIEALDEVGPSGVRIRIEDFGEER